MITEWQKTKTREVRSFAEIDIRKIQMPCIGVYNRPSDYPDKCVARLFDGTKPTNIIITRNTVEEILQDITKCFPAMLPFVRDKEDCKCVAETWI